jgi:SAP domain
MTPGIYFGLPIEEYRADEALGSSDIKTLASCAPDFWHQRYGPFAGDREDTTATEYGRAAHVRIVEGKAAFDAQYYQRLDKGEYPDALVTVEDIKAVLAERGQKVSGKKDDLIARLLEIEPEAPIWDRIVGEYEGRNAGRVPLSADGTARIEYAATMVEADPSET